MRAFRRVARWRSDLAQPALEQRDPPVRQPSVGLELRLARAARADPAAEALEVLPHAAHARQVVLELRELDLELPLGRDGVLGEDVEDQLRAVDDARRERVLERTLLSRLQLIVDDQYLGLAVAVGRLQLLELSLADIRARIRPRSVLDDLCDRRDAGGTRELAQLRELSSASTPRGSTARSSPRSGSGPARDRVRPTVIGRSMPRRAGR